MSFQLFWPRKRVYERRWILINVGLSKCGVLVLVVRTSAFISISENVENEQHYISDSPKALTKALFNYTHLNSNLFSLVIWKM